MAFTCRRLSSVQMEQVWGSHFLIVFESFLKWLQCWWKVPDWQLWRLKSILKQQNDMQNYSMGSGKTHLSPVPCQPGPSLKGPSLGNERVIHSPCLGRPWLLCWDCHRDMVTGCDVDIKLAFSGFTQMLLKEEFHFQNLGNWYHHLRHSARASQNFQNEKHFFPLKGLFPSNKSYSGKLAFLLFCFVLFLTIFCNIFYQNFYYKYQNHHWHCYWHFSFPEKNYFVGSN